MPNHTKPKDAAELREQLLEAFAWVQSDPRRANQVKEMANAAGKVIGTLKLELEYAALRGEKPFIPFLGNVKEIEESDTKKIPEKTK